MRRLTGSEEGSLLSVVARDNDPGLRSMCVMCFASAYGLTTPLLPQRGRAAACARAEGEKEKGEKQATHESECATLGDELGRLVLDQVLDLVRVHRLGNLLDLGFGEEPVCRKDLWERRRLDGFRRGRIGRLWLPEGGL